MRFFQYLLTKSQPTSKYNKIQKNYKPKINNKNKINAIVNHNNYIGIIGKDVEKNTRIA